MRINKPFWLKKNGRYTQAFSYNNPAYPKKFAQQYGGEAVDYIDISEEIASQVGVGSEVYSILTNSAVEKQPTSLIDDPRRFKVLVWVDGEWRNHDEGHATLKEANAVAKKATLYYKIVLVVCKRVTEMPVPEGAVGASIG